MRKKWLTIYFTKFGFITSIVEEVLFLGIRPSIIYLTFKKKQALPL